MTSFTKDYSGQKTLDVLKRRLLIDGFHIVVNIAKSKGAYVYNELDGEFYLDFYSFFGSLPVGFNHPGLKNEAYQRALMDAAQLKPALSDVYSSHLARFVDVFDRVALRGEFRYLFFVEGGGPGVENALKVAFDWKTRLNLKRGKNVEASHILHFQDAFHGRLGYTLSITDSHDARKTQYFPQFPWPRILNPKVNVYEEEPHLKTVEEREEKALGEIQNHLKEFADETAAIIIEPIQSEGGGNHFRKEFFAALRRVADQNDVLLIFDEVQTGMGLSGKWWCWEHFGVKPDIMAFGKKAQVGGIAVTDRIDKDGIDHCFKISSRINSTFGGNLVDMVRATRFIEIIEEENLLQNISKRGEQFLSGFAKLSQKFPVTNIRGIGGILAFDAPTEAARGNILKTAMEKERLILLAAGKRTVRFRPNLSITAKEVDDGLGRLEKALAKVFLS